VTVNADSYLAGYAIDRKNRAKKKTFARAAMLSVMNAEKLAEEIRILYVALSRAKEKLYMTAAVKDPGAEKAVFDYPLQTDFPIKSCLYGTGFLYFVSNDIVTPNSSSFCFLAQSARNPISSSIAVISPPCTLPG